MHCFAFHLMPWDRLPADFDTKYESAWTWLPNSIYDPKHGNELYNRYLDELCLADELGFDGVCVNEHHQNAYGTMPSPNLMGAILARQTKRVKIAVIGNALPLYNPVTRVAEEFAMIDVISGGRLIAGLVVGGGPEYYSFSMNPTNARAMFQEGMDLVIRAWTEPGPFEHYGEFWKLKYVNPWPRPIQQPHPPIWIPGAGSVETWRWAAEMDYVFCYLSYYGYKMAQNVMKGFWEEMARLGKDRNPYRAGFAQVVGVAESRQQALDLYSEAAEYFYGRCLHVDPRFAGPPGYVTEATQRAGIESQVKTAAAGGPATNASSAQKMQSLARDMKGIVDNGYVIVGSPDDVVEQLRELATTLNVGQLMLLMQFGNMSKDVTKYNTRLFAEKVMPKLKPLFAEWENRWWPQPMERRQRATLPAFTPATAAE
jgi:alkanesulfonate monooxygenase SsuD/methylene tetrahydromethanopterin reductase-like flavin-dependent oxidoreductase (luciferase family)